MQHCFQRIHESIGEQVAREGRDQLRVVGLIDGSFCRVFLEIFLQDEKETVQTVLRLPSA